MGKIRKKFEDWMTIITFAEAGEPEAGFQITGYTEAVRKKLALDKVNVVKYEEVEDQQKVSKNSVQTVEQAPEKATVKKELHIMIVDDEPIVGKRLKPALAKYGYDVEVFEDPVKAINRFDEEEFDIVVTDLRMEKMDGIQILEHVMSRSKPTKVIMITGYATVEVAREALVKGAFDFIAKPFKPNDLRMAINKAALSLGHMGFAAATA
jgi:CheY-like chemotaxis protein